MDLDTNSLFIDGVANDSYIASHSNANFDDFFENLVRENNTEPSNKSQNHNHVSDTQQGDAASTDIYEKTSVI